MLGITYVLAFFPSNASETSCPMSLVDQPNAVPNNTPDLTHGPAIDSAAWRQATGRVLHLVNGEHYSGAERVQDLLALRLPEFGYQVGIACVKPKLFPQMFQAREAALYQVAMRSRFDLAAIRQLRDILRRDRYDIIHAHTPRTVLLGGLLSRMTGLPLVYHVHSPVGRDSTRKFQNWVNGQIERISLNRVAQMIPVSSSLGQYMEEIGHAKELMTVVPNGVPAPQQQRATTPPTGTWTIGTVALFRQRKGTEVLLDAIARLRDQGKDVRLRAVGPFETDEYEQMLKQQAARLDLSDRVDWTGFTQDVNQELLQMDLFVLPSLFGEGLPMVVLEAMAAGVPVVGTWVEGVPEAVRDRVDGVLAQPGDAADLARSIACIMDGEVDWSAAQQSALARHDELFSDRSMAGGVAAAYDKLLGVTR